MGSIEFTQDMAQVLLILGFTVYLFVFDVVRVDLAAVTVLVVLGVAGMVPADRMFDGFASNAVISIMALMIMGAGLDRTGVMTHLVSYILRVAGSSERRVIPMISGVAGLVASFMHAIGTAALFLPAVSRISTRTGIPLSRLLMPMGFCAILGGTLTMIGSSPLIVLNDLISSSNQALPAGVAPMSGFGLFAVTPIGVVMLLMGIAYFMLFGRVVLPALRPGASVPGVTSRYFEELYGIQGDIYEATVPVTSPLLGLSIAEVEAQENAPFILGIRVADEIRLEPPRDFAVPAGCTFALMGSEEQVRQFRREMGLGLRPDVGAFVDVLNPSVAGISEAVVAPGSTFVGKTVVEIGMRRRYGIHLLAIYRQEHVIRRELQDVPLLAGDTLVLHSRWDRLPNVAQYRNVVVVTDYPREVTRPHKLWYALGFFALAIGLTLVSDLRLSLALFVGAAGMILSGVLTMDEAYRSIGWQTVFLLACLLPLGIAVETSGTAAWIAQETLHLLGDVPAWVLQAAIALLTTAFTLVMSNIGATVLLVPIAINIAIGAGADPAVFALTVALAASNSFIIPTHQVNALIMGPAGYRVADFMRAGGVVSCLFLVVLIVMMNLLF